MALTNAQLLMLDNLIYTDYCKEDMTVRDVIQDMKEAMDAGEVIDVCEMGNDDWRAMIEKIEKEPVLLEYTVQNLENSDTGMRAACFVDDVANPKDVNVVFRGTTGDFEWHDNGEGGYLTETNQQMEAAAYVNNLPEKYGNNMTVTGHSKGGNKAQYVTIVTNRFQRCVSFDGQGFSEEFLEKYKEQIEKKAQSIISISASNDPVNSLLYSIAGQKMYIETDDLGWNVFNYHRPDILLDENGNLRPRTEQSELSNFINEYTTYMISNLEEPQRSVVIDGLLAMLEKGESKESILQTIYGGAVAISHLDDFAFNYIGETYGLPAELLATSFAAVVCPYLFLDDFFHCVSEIFTGAMGMMMDFAKEIEKKLQEIGQKVAEFRKKFLEAITTFASKTKEWFNKTFNAGYQYASVNTYIKVNTASLRDYASRLSQINRRISNLDSRMNGLYWQVGFTDLFNLLKADALTGYSWRLNRCVDYLNTTASDFEAVERTLSTQ